MNVCLLSLNAKSVDNLKEEAIFLRDTQNKNASSLYKKRFKSFKIFNRNMNHKKKMVKVIKLIPEEGYLILGAGEPLHHKIFICPIDTEKTHR